MLFRMTLAASLCLTIGACDRWNAPPIEVQPEVAEADLRAFYCDQTDTFRWTDAAWGWVVENDPANTRRALGVNERRDRWCQQ